LDRRRFFSGRLTDELADFAKAKVAARRYTSSGEVVREPLRLMGKLEQQEAEKLSFASWCKRGSRSLRLRFFAPP
jgi:Arc/MetJ-type ribon-helix-helix transcriptional regulator